MTLRINTARLAGRGAARDDANDNVVPLRRRQRFATDDRRRSSLNPDFILIGDDWVLDAVPVTPDPEVPAPPTYPFTDAERAYWASDEAKDAAARWRQIADEEDAVAQALAEIAQEDAERAEADARRPRDVVDDYIARLDPQQAQQDLDETVERYVAQANPQAAQALAAERALIDEKWGAVEDAAARAIQNRQNGTAA